MADGYTKVCIVDDEMLIRQGILHYIDWEKEGFTIVGEAANGKEALDLIETTAPDIVITDIVMPIMNGTELIKTIKTRYPHIDLIVLSSYADFDYVRETFKNGVEDYILKPKLDAVVLLETLKRLQNKQEANGRNKGFRPLDPAVCLKKALKQMASEEDLSTLKSDFSGPIFHLLRIKKSRFLAPDTSDAFTAKDMRVELIDQEKALYLLNGTKEASEDFIATKREEKSNLTYLMSEPFTDLADLGQIYEHVIKPLSRYYFFLSEQSVLTCSRLPTEEKSIKPFDIGLLLMLFNQKKWGEMKTYIDHHFMQQKQGFKTDPNEVKSLLGNLIFNLTNQIKGSEAERSNLEKRKYQYFNAINHAGTFIEAYYHFQLFFDEVMKHESDGPQEKHTDLDDLLAHIEAHYHEPLTLTDIAEQFHFNPSYLSSYFSQHLNQGFTDYLTALRMKKAKELLTDSQYNIADVGAMVGYPDHSYFCKVFKKHTDLSPSKFRKVKQS